MSRSVQTNAPEQRVPLAEGAPAVGYASETLRRYMWALEPEDRPPLTKFRGRWVVKVSELTAWADARDARAAS